MNTLQRKVLIGVALLIGAMLLYPPFSCEANGNSIGIGYAFIFSSKGKCWGHPGAVNAAQLVAQWVGVAIVGAIVFALAKDYQPKDRSAGITVTTVIAAAGLARQRSMIWIWLGLSGFAVRMLYVFSNNSSENLLSAFGLAGAGMLFFVIAIIWHTTRILYLGPVVSLPTPNKPIKWTRILILSFVSITFLGGLFAWNEAKSDNQITETFTP